MGFQVSLGECIGFVGLIGVEGFIGYKGSIGFTGFRVKV